jgi:stage IV sporulation protein FB
MILLLGWINSFSIIGTLIWAVVILFSVLVHEFGHALTALAFNQRAEIELFGMGGLTLRQGPPLKFWQEFFVVLNGPLAGFLLFFLFYKFKELLNENSYPFLVYAFNVTIYVNFFWTIVNLLPIHPLDGGQLLRIILEAIMGIRGIKIAFFISMLFSLALTVLAFTYQEIFLGSLFFILTFEGYRGWKNALSITEQDHNQELKQLFKEAEQEMHQGNSESAYQKLQRVRDFSKAGVVYNAATEYMAQILNELGKFKDAYSLLLPLSNKLTPDSLCLLHKLAYKLGYWEEAILLGNRSYQYYPTYETALINAYCHSILGEQKPAIGWLKTAIDEGLPNINQILKKREFDHIRDHPQFQNLTRSAN